MGILTPDEMAILPENEIVVVPKKLLLELIDRADTDCYDGDDDEIGSRVCCFVISYEDHAHNCPVKKMKDYLETLK